MKYILIPLAIIICAIFIFLTLNRLEKIEIQTSSGSQIVMAEVVKTVKAKERGLMERPDLPEGRGMLFVYADDMDPNFWMKNMLIPLDIIFIDANHVIKHIAKDVPPCEPDTKCALYSPDAPVRYVLEVKAGYTEKYGVKVGNKVLFN